MSAEKDSLTKELDNKLEDLFDEDTLDDENESQPAFSEKRPAETVRTEKKEAPVIKSDPKNENKPKSFPLDNLNAILLSLDWEITDELINSYLSEIRKLKTKYGTDKFCDYFFRILDNLGRYIKKNLGAAHPESVSMMQSIHQSLESIFLNSELSEVQKKKVFYKEYNKYLKFKQKITLKKAGKKPGDNDVNVETDKFAEVFISRISESLRKVVREELEKVKKEILESVNK
ncbi:MAG: hypothetical protein H6680_06820 [Desulfobacteraceae bacterium]|nr:hypothetical protein [Desulfobacteraceae bacterium]